MALLEVLSIAMCLSFFLGTAPAIALLLFKLPEILSRGVRQKLL